uniref:Uncharacterized protein n=1 Tax=Anguilla anguilla TaxID=7936 RepID=A0A0E9V969_ANGAN
MCYTSIVFIFYGEASSVRFILLEQSPDGPMVF